MFLFTMLELKYGWHPAVLNDAEELEFIQRNLNGLINKQNFYIGGTTNFNSTGILSNFSDYLPNSTGKQNVRQFYNVLCQHRNTHFKI